MSEPFFWWSEKQLRLSKKVSEFVDNNIEEAEYYFWKKKFPWPLVKKVSKEGFFGAGIPKEYGGSGMSYLEHYIVTEALNYECPSIAQMIGISHLATGPILLGATEEQKKKFIGTMTKSYRSGCFCLTEPEAGSDAAVMETVAEKKGSGYIINGTKRFITNGKYFFMFLLSSETNLINAV